MDLGSYRAISIVIAGSLFGHSLAKGDWIPLLASGGLLILFLIRQKYEYEQKAA